MTGRNQYFANVPLSASSARTPLFSSSNVYGMNSSPYPASNFRPNQMNPAGMALSAYQKQRQHLISNARTLLASVPGTYQSPMSNMATYPSSSSSQFSQFQPSHAHFTNHGAHTNAMSVSTSVNPFQTGYANPNEVGMHPNLPRIGYQSKSNSTQLPNIGTARTGSNSSQAGLGAMPLSFANSAHVSAVGQNNNHDFRMRQYDIARKKAMLAMQRQQMTAAMRQALARRGAHPIIHASAYNPQGSGGAFNGPMNASMNDSKKKTGKKHEKESSFAESAKKAEERLAKQKRKKQRAKKKTTGEKSKETKNWLSDFLKKEGIEKLADEQPDDKQIENKSKYLQNRNGEDDSDFDAEKDLDELRKAREQQQHTDEAVLNMIKRINSCKYLRRPSYRKKELEMLQKKHPDLSPTEFILPPKSAFRGICFAVRAKLRFVSTYSIANYAAAMVVRSRSSKNLYDLLKLYFDVIKAWLANTVAIPIKSISQHLKLDFSVASLQNHKKKSSKKLSKKKLAQLARRMLQLRIHTGHVLTSLEKIIKAGNVPMPIIDFLVQLTNPGMYLPRSFFFPSEEFNISFTLFGATKPMGQWTSKRIILNVFYTRLLIPWCCLQPWYCGLASMTAQKSDRLKNNLKVIASLLYEMVFRTYQKLIKDLPTVKNSTDHNDKKAYDPVNSLPPGGTSEEVSDLPPPNLSGGTLGETTQLLKLGHKVQLLSKHKMTSRRKSTSHSKTLNAHSSPDGSLYTHEEINLGKKYLQIEEISSQVFPISYFDKVYAEHLSAFVDTEVQRIFTCVASLYKQVVHRRQQLDAEARDSKETNETDPPSDSKTKKLANSSSKSQHKDERPSSATPAAEEQTLDTQRLDLKSAPHSTIDA